MVLARLAVDRQAQGIKPCCGAVAGALRRHVAGHGQKNAPKPNDLGAFKMVLKYRIGGDGGNRTLYFSLPFNWLYETKPF